LVHIAGLQINQSSQNWSSKLKVARITPFDGTRNPRNTSSKPSRARNPNKNIENLSTFNEGWEWTYWKHAILNEFDKFSKLFPLMSNFYWKIVRIKRSIPLLLPDKQFITQCEAQFWHLVRGDNIRWMINFKSFAKNISLVGL
jgi:hypothetical protein